MGKLIGTVAVLAALCACAIAPAAHAAKYEFAGDKGTTCTVEVAARASDTIGALSGLPRVGFSSNPVCHYASAPGATSNVAGAKAAAKACKKKRSKRAKARCKAKKRKHQTRAVPTLVSAPALLDLAKLNLLTPLGLKVPGAETLASLGLGGYTCLLGIGANCSDTGQLEPAIPFVSYLSQFSIHLTPPPGEHWISEPAGCTGLAALTCVLSSESVTPTL